MSELFRFENFTKSYDEKEILNIQNFSFQKNKISGLMGANGSGKSTILRHLAFLQKPTSGHVYYENTPDLSANNPLKKQISILFSEPYLLQRSVYENLIYSLKIYNIKCDFLQKSIEILNLVGLNESFLKRYPNTLSSGEKQRVAFATRLITNPKTILLDEPTNSLDELGIPQFSKLILYANKNLNTSFIIVSHDKIWLQSICDDTFFLQNGNIYPSENFLKGSFQNNTFTLQNFSLKIKNEKLYNDHLGLCIDPKKISLYKNNQNNKLIKAKIISISYQKNDICISLHVNSQNITCILQSKVFLLERFNILDDIYFDFYE